MEYFRPEVKVGGLLLAALVLVVLAALMVGNLGNWFADKERYTVLFRNTHLMRAGTRVSYAGYPVGQVTAMTVRPPEARAQQDPEYPVAVTITVHARVPIRQDSRVEMKTEGMIGDLYVDILPGMGPPLSPGDVLRGELGGLDGLLASVAGGEGGVQDMLATLNSLLTDTSRPDSIPSTLASLKSLLDTLPTFLSPLVATVDELGQAIRQDVSSTRHATQQLLQEFDDTLAENRTGIRRLIGELNTALAETRHTMAEARVLLQTSQEDIPTFLKSLRDLVEGVQQSRQALAARMDKLLADIDAVVVQNDSNIYTTIEHLRTTAAHLEAAAELVRANPAVLVWGSRGQDGAAVAPVAKQGKQRLQERGRIGRYDRVR